jgi:type IV pilus assembly protein PilW
MSRPVRPSCTPARRQKAFSLIELMIALTIGLLILAALVALFVNTSGGAREMARANSLIENGRSAIELLQGDIVHGGYWGSYMPTYDDQTSSAVPADEPAAVPDPCLAYATPWTAAHKQDLLGIPVQVYDSNAVCSGVVLDKLANTDVLLVRHAGLCIPGSGGNCEADVANMLYFQSTRCLTDVDRYLLDTTGFTLHQRDCTAIAEKRRFVSNIYYVRDYAVTAGDGIPTLMRSAFDLSGGVLSHKAPVALVEGIQGFRIELGVDDRSKAYTGNPTGSPVNYNAAVNWLDPSTREIPTNRGDGAPDGAFISCTTGSPCTADQLMNVTAVKIYVLVRSREPSKEFTDTKTYTLGGTTMGPFNDKFRRHVYVTTVRLPNVAGRRQTP